MLENAAGWWQSILILDLDGNLGCSAGNYGFNSRSRPRVDVWPDDFDCNGSLEQIMATTMYGLKLPRHLRHDLAARIPHLILDGGKLHEVKPKAGGYDASYSNAFVTPFMEAWTRLSRR